MGPPTKKILLFSTSKVRFEVIHIPITYPYSEMQASRALTDLFETGWTVMPLPKYVRRIKKMRFVLNETNYLDIKNLNIPASIFVARILGLYTVFYIILDAFQEAG